MKRALLSMLLCVGLFGDVAARAQTKNGTIAVQWDGYQPRVSFSMVSMVDEHVKSQLSNGLKKRFVVTVQGLDGSRVIASRVYSCSITYDLWDNAFLVAIGKHQARTPTLTRATQLCLNTQTLRVGEAADFQRLSGKEVKFTVRVEFDPISKDQCEAMVRPGTSNDLIAPVAINLVRREICAAGRIAEVSSQPIKVP